MSSARNYHMPSNTYIFALELPWIPSTDGLWSGYIRLRNFWPRIIVVSSDWKTVEYWKGSEKKGTAFFWSIFQIFSTFFLPYSHSQRFSNIILNILWFFVYQSCRFTLKVNKFFLLDVFYNVLWSTIDLKPI